uniref:Uncharacterized protein n=1 Tax=Oryza sativa subsp. japonica TaxID=39947 RepID=Q6AUD6_ORYSJ|nr:hypothetical protein [Oryza sativa Japonica Group]
MERKEPEDFPTQGVAGANFASQDKDKGGSKNMGVSGCKKISPPIWSCINHQCQAMVLFGRVPGVADSAKNPGGLHPTMSNAPP